MTKAQDFECLAQEHGVLMLQYGYAQARCSELLVTQAAEIVRLQAEAMRLRAAVIVRDTALAYAREDGVVPIRLGRMTWLGGGIALWMRLREWTSACLGRGGASATHTEPVGERASLCAKSVLCVGQDKSGASVAQRVVEMAGGQFLHHDGGDAADPDDGEALEASLIAADLVICQAGCVSHNAYWRVRDHCTRTGKQCVLVEQPQAMQLVRSAQAPSAQASHQE